MSAGLLPPLIDVTDPAVAASRSAAEAYAQCHGYFWLPCPLCGTMFGGHEHPHDRSQGIPHIPDLEAGPWNYLCICPWCTRAGRGCDVP